MRGGPLDPPWRSLPCAVASIATDAWFTALAERIATLVPGIDPPIGVEQVITDPAPGERSRWRVELGPERVVLDPDPATDAPPPTVSFVCDRATAIGLASGELNAQHAIAGGRLRVLGDVARIVAIADRLGALGFEPT